jgi:hypothetical protein
MNVCCGSRASICYWLVASFTAWAIFGSCWNFLAPTTCLVGDNRPVRRGGRLFKNRTYHCVLTGPLFLIAAILFLSSELTHVKADMIWAVVLVGTGIALFLV